MDVVKSLKFMERPKRSIMSQAETEGATTMFENRKEFKGAVIGMVLGDGHLAKIRKTMKNSYLSIRHGIAQKEYAEYKGKLLEWLTSIKVTEREQNFYKQDRKQQIIDVRTKIHPMYTKLRNRFYYEGRKTVTEHLMKMLTPLGLALWYQDDGCFAYHGGYQEVYLNTQNFNLAEHELMARHLQKSFGLQFRPNRAQSKYFSLRLRRKDRAKFLDIIKPFVAPSMKYKTEITDDWENLEGRRQHDKITVTCALCGKVYERHYHEGSSYMFCGDCYNNRRKECTEISNNKGRDQENLGQDIVCSAWEHAGMLETAYAT